jgi:alpha-glucosidase
MDERTGVGESGPEGWAGVPPNNWLSNFGGSGWEWDATTRQYYYHSFLKQQPDVNWRKPKIDRIVAIKSWISARFEL